MTTLFLILIILASVILGLIILIQNPKGGGLAGSLSGFNTQFMGVKQTNDVLEKGTWIFVIIIAVLSILSPMAIKSSNGGGANTIDRIGAPSNNAPVSNPATTTPFPTEQPASTNPTTEQPAPVNP